MANSTNFSRAETEHDDDAAENNGDELTQLRVDILREFDKSRDAGEVYEVLVWKSVEVELTEVVEAVDWAVKHGWLTRRGTTREPYYRLSPTGSSNLAAWVDEPAEA